LPPAIFAFSVVVVVIFAWLRFRISPRRNFAAAPELRRRVGKPEGAENQGAPENAAQGIEVRPCLPARSIAAIGLAWAGDFRHSRACSER